MDLQAIRAGLADKMLGAAGVRPYSFPAELVMSNVGNIAVSIAPAVDFIDYWEAFQNGLAQVHYVLTPFVSATSTEHALNQLDALLSSGAGLPSSLIDVLMVKPRTLGGVCSDLVVVSVANVARVVTVDGTDFLTAEILVRIYVGRS